MRQRTFTVALLVMTLGLFVATSMLSFSESAQRKLLATTIRSSGWVAYQGQLEYVKTMAALDVARANPDADALDRLAFRMEILLSRLRILRGSEDGRVLESIGTLAAALTIYEDDIEKYVTRLEGSPPNAALAPALLANWREDLNPLGRDLQKILEAAVVYNEEIFRREKELASSPATVPLALMFLCGAGLVSLLVVQAGRDRRRLEEVLTVRQAQATLEQNFRAAIETIPAIVVIFDPLTHEVRFLNHAAGDIIDRSPEHPGWAPLTRAAVESVQGRVGGDMHEVKVSVSRDGGEVVSLRGGLREVVWKERAHYLLALADVTRVRDAELQLMQAAKLATLGEMATAIAHETNQPLAVIKMAVANARRLLDGGAPGAPLLAKLDRIDDQVERVRRITDQVRRYGRMAGQQREPFALRAAIDLAISFVAEQYRASGIRLNLHLEFSADLAAAGEQTMFEQVIVNILVNARDALEGADGPDRPAVTVRGSLAGARVWLEIEDNAGGIAPDILPRIFEPFTTSKPVGTGTGLGLSMSRNIVRDMGGDITAANTARGARFTIDLPARRLAAGPAAPDAKTPDREAA